MTPQWLGDKGFLSVSDYTTKVVKQTLVTGKKSKNTPYLYEVVEPNFKELDMATLEVIERNAWDITEMVMKEMERRERMS